MKKILLVLLLAYCSVVSAGVGGYTELTQDGDYQYGVNLGTDTASVLVSAVNDSDVYITGRVQTDIKLADSVVFVPRIDINADYHTGQDGWYKSVYDRGRAHEYRNGYLPESNDGWYKSVFGRGMLYASPTDDFTVRAGAGYGFGQDNSDQLQLYAGVDYQYSDFNFDYGLNVRRYNEIDFDFDRYIHEFQLTYTGYDIEPYVLVGWDGDNDTYYDRYSWIGVQMQF